MRYIIFFCAVIFAFVLSAQEVHHLKELVWKPYVYWQRPGGVRPTTDAFGLDVWMFGGSAVWGSGVEWSETIPSYLATKGYTVTNYGEVGYVSTQELILLILELRSATPNIVIFYDGYNDVFSGYQQGVAGLPMNEFNRVKEFNITKKGLVNFIQAKLHDEPRHELRSDLDIWKFRDGNIRIAKAIGEQFGFKVYDFWQPERKFGYPASFRVPEEYFIDDVHLTKEGNEIIANRIYEAINQE